MNDLALGAIEPARKTWTFTAARRKPNANPARIRCHADAMIEPAPEGDSDGRASMTVIFTGIGALSTPFLRRRNGERIGPITSLLVFEEVEVGRASRTGHVLAGHTDEGAGEVRGSGRGRFVGENARVELLWEPTPVVVRAFNSTGEVEPFVIDFDTQVHWLAAGNSDEWRKRIGLQGIWNAGHHAKMFADGFIVGNVEVMEFCAVVVAHEAGYLLKMFWLEFNDRGGADAMRLLAPRDERLSKRRAQCLPSDEAEESGARREAEDFFRPRRAQPLEINRQIG